MFVYESRPSDPGGADLARAAGLARNAHGFSLVTAVHPKCPCTRASVAELTSGRRPVASACTRSRS